MSNQRLSELLKALSDPMRRRIMALIHQGEKCGCELIHRVDISQPTLSHHLKVLSTAGLIQGIKTKSRVNYTVNMKALESLSDAIKNLFDYDEEAC